MGAPLRRGYLLILLIYRPIFHCCREFKEVLKCFSKRNGICGKFGLRLRWGREIKHFTLKQGKGFQRWTTTPNAPVNKTAVVKTAIKRLGNRSGKIKNALLAGCTSHFRHLNLQHNHRLIPNKSYFLRNCRFYCPS